MEEGDTIFTVKTDVKDGFWRCVTAEGQEWNFAYVLQQKEGGPIRLVIPKSLQMGWIELPGYFCAASKTGRDVAEAYAKLKIGTLPDHNFPEYTNGSPEYEALPNILANRRPLKFMIEVYVDNYINLAMTRSKQDLDHISNATMHRMHCVFPANKVDNEDPILKKKMTKKDGQWRIEKDVLGWTFKGVEKTMVL